MKKFGLLISIFFFVSQIAWGQLLIENFDFSGKLTDNGWTAHSGAGTNPISTTAGLEYTNYPGSGIGNAALIGNLGGEDDNKGFTPQTDNTSSIYFSFLVNITDTNSNKTGDYFIHIGNAASPTSFTSFASRIFAKISNNVVNFGLSNSSTATYGTTEFSKNNTYLLIVKYTINTSGNDTVSLWVRSSGIPSSENNAGDPEVINSSTTGQDIINAIALRQGSSTTSPQVVVDGIRVGTSWNDLFPSTTPTLVVNPTSLTGFTYVEGSGPSASQSYTLSGSDLTPADSVVTVAGSTNFEVSSNNVTFTDTLKIDYTGGVLADTTIYVRLKAGLVAGDYNGEIISNLGGGATQQDVTVDGSVTSIPSLSGDYYIGAPGTGPNGSDPQFASLRDAFQVLNNSPFSGNCTFYITSDLDEPFPYPAPNGDYGLGLAINPDPYTVTFKPYAGVQPTITLEYPVDQTSGPSGALVIGIPTEGNIAWADMRTTKNIIIDGSNTVGGTTRDLTIQSAATAHRNAMTVVIVGDVSNLTIKNTNIYYKVQAVSTSGNLFIGAVQVRSRNEGGKDYVPHDLLFENNHLNANFDGNPQSAQGYGTYQSGTPVPAALPYNITLKNNLIEGKRRAISLYMAGSHNIIGNEIILNQDIASNTTNEAIYAVNVLSNSVVNIQGNKISKVSSKTSLTANGNTAISIETAGTYNVYNNMIYGFELTAANPIAYLRGIKNSSASSTLNLNFNSIFLPDLNDIGTGSVTYQGILLSDGTNSVENNIVVSNEKDFPSYCIYRSGSLGTLTSDYNDFYPATDSVRVGYFNTTATPTLIDWQTASTQDAKSVSKEVFFVSDNDLHLTGTSNGDLDLAGAPITGITTDIDGDTRSTEYPYKGADEASIKLVPWVTIAVAREDLNSDGIPDKLGQTLKIRGVVISPNFQTVNHSYYIWDGTAGIAEYLAGTTSPVLSLGDSVEMVGKIDLYRGLTEFSLSSANDLTILGTGATLPTPLELTIAQYKANPEAYEGTLLKFNSLYKISTSTWPANNASATLKFTDNADTLDFRIDSDTNIDGSTEPTWPANIVGIGSQFSSSATSYFDGYQILPRYITDFTSVASSVENEKTTVTQFELAQNYPNPFNPTTRIKYSIPFDSKVTISVYSITGELVTELVNDYKSAGTYSVDFNGSNLASGVYIYRMMAGNFVQVHKMLLMK